MPIINLQLLPDLRMKQGRNCKKTVEQETEEKFASLIKTKHVYYLCIIFTTMITIHV